MTESIFDRLARKIEQAKQRAERERQEGFLRKDPTGWSYKPPPPATPAKPQTKSLQDYLAQAWYQTALGPPPQAGMYPIAFGDPRRGARVYWMLDAQSFWDGKLWHIGGPDTRHTSVQAEIWWTFP